MKKNKVLSVFSLVMINIIAIDSLRNLPLNATQGYAIVFFYLVGGLCFLLPCILATTKLVKKYPHTGGSYIWVREAFGEGPAFLTAWLLWIYNVVWFPTILLFISGSVAYLINPQLAQDKLFMVTITVMVFLVATVVNSYGMKISSLVTNLGAMIGTIIPMLFIILLAVIWLAMGKPIALQPSTGSWLPNLTQLDSWSFFLAVLFSLIGIEMSAVHAGDVRNPQRSYPLALRISSIFIVISMTLASVAITLIMPADKLNLVTGLNQAFSIFLTQINLSWLLPVVVGCIIVGGFAGISAWVIGPARAIMVAAEDKAAPPFFAKKNRHGAPKQVLLVQAVIVIILSLVFVLFKSLFEFYWILSDLTAQLALLYYLLIFFSAYKLNYQASSRRWRVAIIVGIVTCILAIAFGFIPPKGIPVTSTLLYDLILLAGMTVFVLPALVRIYTVGKNSSGSTTQKKS